MTQVSTRGVVAEALGTALLLATVVGSGIMAERLAGGNVAVALLANTIATGGALVALILIFGPISGAHFNPVVTLTLSPRGARCAARRAVAYIAAQIRRRGRRRVAGASDVRSADAANARRMRAARSAN